MIYFSHCPVCKSENINAAFSAKDYTVSHESFVLTKCNNCTAMFTQDIPSQEKIGAYYASENYISHSDTQEGFVNKMYHRIRRRTLVSKRRLVQKETNLQHGNILDIGTGSGAFLNEMRAANWAVTGLEPDDTARKKAIELYDIEPLSSDQLFQLPFGKYDAITMWHVLEHVHQLHEYVAAFKNLLSDKAKLFIAVPNYTSYDAAHYKEHWAAYDVPRHLYHFSPASMQKLMSEHGLRVKKMKPMWFDSFYVSMLSEQYRNNKSNLIKAFFTGLVSNTKAFFNKEKCSSVIYIIEKA